MNKNCGSCGKPSGDLLIVGDELRRVGLVGLADGVGAAGRVEFCLSCMMAYLHDVKVYAVIVIALRRAGLPTIEAKKYKSLPGFITWLLGGVAWLIVNVDRRK